MNTVAWGGEDFLVRVDPGTGRAVRFETEAWDPSWSADARALVFAARGECKQIYGIYRIEADGSDLRRLTNGCRVVGTAGADALHGSPRVDVLVGGPGNDRLRAVDQPLTGDDLFGGPGDDVLNGGDWANRLEGGAGRDRLWGAMGADMLVGGQGRDAVHGGFGDDVLVTADGAPDRLECGRGALDVAAADRFDVVSRDCEVAIRMRPVAADRTVALRVLYRPQGPSGPRRRFTLSCDPPAGTHPKPGSACEALAAVIDPFRPFADGVRTPCEVLERRDPHTAQVDGVYRGRPVHTVFQRLDTCSLQRWNRVGRFLAELPFAP